MSNDSVAAQPELTAVPSTIEVEGNQYWTAYTGTRDDLVAAGLAPEDLFPVWPKRRFDNYAPGMPLQERLSIRRVKGGRFCVKLERPLPKPTVRAPWDPLEFRVSMARWLGAAFEVAIRDAQGGLEAEHHGTATHRFAEKDVQRLQAARDQALATILQAHVQRAGTERLKLV